MVKSRYTCRGLGTNTVEAMKHLSEGASKAMEDFQVGNKIPGSIPVLNVDTLDGNFRSISKLLEEDTGYDGNEEETSDNESDSLNSTRTDQTFENWNTSKLKLFVLTRIKNIEHTIFYSDISTEIKNRDTNIYIYKYNIDIYIYIYT